MGSTKCHYYKCVSKNGDRSMFRFPVNDSSRLKLWIENSGNLKLTCLTLQELRRRYICEEHFDSKYILRHMCRARLLPTAVPFKYDHITPPYNSFLAKLTPEMLKIRRQCKYHFEKRYKNDIDREGNESESEDDDDDDSDSYNANCECEPKGVTGVKAAPTCTDCETPITGFGFQWWCLQCGGLRCSQCALRISHRPHLLLRSPANTTSEHARIVIEAIRNELQHEDFFKPQENEDTIPTVIEEPIVKVEPPDEAEDPLAECNNSSRLTFEKNIDPPIRDKPSLAFQVIKSGDHTIESINHRSNKTRSQAGPSIDLNNKHSNHRLYKSHAQPNNSGDRNIESNKYRSDKSQSQSSASVDQDIEPFNRSKDSQPQCSSPIDLNIDLIDQQSNDSQTDLTHDSNYQPSRKSLDLVNLLQYQQNLDYLGLNDSDRPIESLCLTCRPNKKKCREKKCTCENDIDYRPSEESIRGFKNQPGQVVGPDDYINNSLFTFHKDGERVSLESEDIRCSVGLQSALKDPGRSVTGVRLLNEDFCPPRTKKMRAETCTRDQEKDSPNTKTQISNKFQQPITPSLTKDKSSNREIIILNFDNPEINKTQSSADKT